MITVLRVWTIDRRGTGDKLFPVFMSPGFSCRSDSFIVIWKKNVITDKGSNFHSSVSSLVVIFQLIQTKVMRKISYWTYKNKLEWQKPSLRAQLVLLSYTQCRILNACAREKIHFLWICGLMGRKWSLGLDEDTLLHFLSFPVPGALKASLPVAAHRLSEEQVESTWVHFIFRGILS